MSDAAMYRIKQALVLVAMVSTLAALFWWGISHDIAAREQLLRENPGCHLVYLGHSAVLSCPKGVTP